MPSRCPRPCLARSHILPYVKTLCLCRLWRSLSCLFGGPPRAQLYIDGEFIGGCDICIDMYQSGVSFAALRHLNAAGTSVTVFNMHVRADVGRERVRADGSWRVRWSRSAAAAMQPNADLCGLWYACWMLCRSWWSSSRLCKTRDVALNPSARVPRDQLARPYIKASSFDTLPPSNSPSSLRPPPFQGPIPVEERVPSDFSAKLKGHRPFSALWSISRNIDSSCPIMHRRIQAMLFQ